MANDKSKNKQHSEPASGVAGTYRELRQSLLRYVRRYLKKSPHDAEDVVQEAFVKAMDTLREGELRSPRAFLYKSTRNLALNAIDKSAYKLTEQLGDLLAENVVADAPSAEQQFESRERFELCCRAIRQLPPKRRRVFVLRRVYGLTQKEIAARMNISLKTVENHLAIALAEMMEHMEALEGSGSGRRAGRDAARKGKLGND